MMQARTWGSYLVENSRRRNSLTEAADAATLSRFRTIASMMRIPGWDVTAADVHGMSWIYVERHDGAKVLVRVDGMSMSKPNKKLNVFGNYLRTEGGHFRGVGYAEKTPEIHVTLKADEDLYKFAKRLDSAIKKRFLPKYLPMWKKGKVEAEAQDRYEKKKASVRAALLKAHPKLLKAGSGDGLSLKLKKGHGDVTFAHDDVSIELRWISADDAKKVLRALA